MRELFLIKQLMSKESPSSQQGYWDGDSRFRGIVFAKEYATYPGAVEAISKALPKGYYNIEKIIAND